MTAKNSGLIYGLNDTPSFFPSTFAAIQHVLASFLSIAAPPLIIANALGLQSEIPYLISMAFIISGVATYIQSRTIGPIGSGLLALQGTSFAFVGPLIAGGFIAKKAGASNEEVLALLFTACFLGSFIEIILSQFMDKLRSIITPIVTGVVITSIGVYLIKVGIIDMAGGFLAKKTGTFASGQNLLLAFIVIAIIVILQCVKNKVLRLSSVFTGMLVGYLVATGMGLIDFSKLGSTDLISIPIPFKYGFGFNWSILLTISFMYLVTAIETTGDLTAISEVSGEPVEGDLYMKRVKNGVLGDGVNSLLAAVFNTFPNTTFSQGTGVIHITGVASRKVGYFIGGIFVLLGLFPITGELFKLIPRPVLGGALVILFATIAVAGIRILASQEFNRRNMLIMAISFAFGFGVMLEPALLSNAPDLFQRIFSSSITTSGVVAIIMTIVLPKSMDQE